MELSPGKILPLRATVYRRRELYDVEAYRWLVERHLNAAFNEPIGPDAAVCLERGDDLAADERYVLFQNSIYVGSSPNCAIHLPHISVAPHHALLLYLAGSFWLEPLTTSFATRFDGRLVPQEHLVPLAPDNFIQLGDIPLTVDEFKQRILDY